MEVFAIGAASGMTGVLLSHPIDTIKTNIQKNGVINRSQLNTVSKLYRGIWSPLLGVGFEKAIVFGMYDKVQGLFINPNRSIPLVNVISGAVAGLSASFLVTPYERIKILLQNGSSVQRETFRIRSLFRGLSMTFTREVPGFAIYFSVYEWMKYNLHIKTRKPFHHYHSFLYGGLSGAAAWIFIYPQDRIKTLIQSTTETQLTGNRLSYYWRFIQNNGGFYKGFSWALYRAVLLHSGTFAMMEFLTSIKNYRNNIDIQFW
jgi:solute carrier family 25 carnitine/acylcarnitine transporter 20/29